MANITYQIEYAKSNRSTCKKSKVKIEKGELRIGKNTPSPFNEGEMMTAWFRVDPFFEMMRRMRKDSKKVESTDDLPGYDDLSEEDQELIAKKIHDFYDATLTIVKKKPTPKKRKAKAEDDEDEDEKPAVPKKPKAAPKKKKEPHPSEVIGCGTDRDRMREVADMLVEKARNDQIKMPTDDAAARKAAGATILSILDKEGGTVDLGPALDALEKQFGTSKNAKKMEVANEENRDLAEAFVELSGYEFKNSNRMGGIAFRKAATAIAECSSPLKSGAQAAKLNGVGKSSAQKVDEYLTGGVIQRLEEFKATGGEV